MTKIMAGEAAKTAAGAPQWHTDSLIDTHYTPLVTCEQQLTRKGASMACRRLARELLTGRSTEYVGGRPRCRWGAHVLPKGAQLSAERVDELRKAGELPRLLPYAAESAGGGQLPWRCEEYYEPPSDAGIGCVLRVLCSLVATSVARLQLMRDEPLRVQGGAGSEIDFATAQAAIERLVKTDAPAGALVLRRVRTGAGVWRVLELEDGVFIWGAWLRRENGAVKSHAIGFNAEAKLLYLGFVTLALTEGDLSELDAFVEQLDLDHGIFVGDDDADLRRVYVVPSHPGACALPCFPPGCLAERPRPPAKKRRR